MVGAAIVRDGRVLAARRTAPASAAGRWEFPGGKVEPGETDAESLVREIEEELGVADPGRALAGGRRADRRALPAHGRRWPRSSGGEPAPTEHDQVRWLGRDELGEVDWLEPDRPFLTELSQVLPSLDG